MTREEKTQWLINNMDLYPLAVSEKSFYNKMKEDDLDSLICIENSRINRSLSKIEILELVNIIRHYQKGTEAYDRPWRQWMDNYFEMLN